MRLVITISYWLLAGLASSMALAQSTEPAPIPRYVTQQELQTLRGEVQALKSDISALSSNVAEILNRISPPPSPDRHITQSDLDKVANELRGDIKALEILLGQQQDETRRLLDDVAYRSNGRAALKIRALMDNNPEFRQEITDIVQQSQSPPPVYGRLIIENRMPTVQYVRVNREGFYIAKDEVREFAVPVGTVSAELVGYELPKNWYVGAPNYAERIVIRPRDPYPYPVYPVYPVNTTISTSSP